MMKPAARVWLLNLALLAVAAALFVGPVRGLAPLAHPYLPWWLMALAFGAAERCVVHLHFRGGAHSFSLGDVPLVFGLIFCSGPDLVIGWVLGSTLVLGLDRRLPPVKLVFNVAQFAVGASVAVLVQHALAPLGGQIALGTWLAALAATQACGAVTVLLIDAAMSLSGEQLRLRSLLEMFAMDSVVTMSNSSLGVCGVMMTVADPRALPLLGIPFGTLFIAYRSYLAERKRDRQLDFVHEANRALAGSHEVAEALEELLVRSLDAFRAESAELVLFGSEQAPSLRTVCDAAGSRELMEAIDPAVADQLRQATSQGAAVILDPRLSGEELAGYLRTRRVTNAILAPLPGDERFLGTIMLANRRGVEHDFDHHDLRLLETLAGNASAALQYDRLGHTVRQLSRAQEQLQHEASHDPLTGVAARPLFVRKVTEALSTRARQVAVLFIDLDNFKTVNDSLGHAAGDDLLINVASRLQRCLRENDVVARLGGDEFAVLLCGGADPRAAASSVARRIVEACRLEVGAGPAAVPIQASVGIAMAAGRRLGAEDLIAEADGAMYSAKRAGKGRFHVSDPRQKALTETLPRPSNPRTGGGPERRRASAAITRPYMEVART